MKHLSWLNAGLLVLVAALALFAYLKPSTSASEYRLSMLENVKTLKIETGVNTPIALERTDTAWSITAPFIVRADSFQVQHILAILNATAKDRLPASDLTRFDLMPPPLRLTIDGQTFGFGMINALTHEQYVLTRDYIYLIAPGYGAALPREVWPLVSRQLFGEKETPIAFEFPDFKIAQNEGKWALTSVAKSELSQDDFNRWVDNWRYASALAVQPANKHLVMETITTKLQDGRSVKLEVIQRAPQLVLTRDDQPAIEYQFTDDVARQLLAPPGTETKK